MIDPNRRARSLVIAVAALALVVAAAGSVAAQSPSPVASGAPLVPTAAPASPAAIVAPSASPTAPSTSPVPSTAPVPKTPVALLLPNTTDARWATVDQVAFAAKLTEVCPTASLDSRNAGGDGATQARQAQEALAAGARVLVLDPGRCHHRRGHRDQRPRRRREGHQL